MKTRYLDVIFTKHAINRLHNRNLSQSDAWDTFKHPDGSLLGKTVNSRKFYKNYGKQRIEVIAKKNEKGEWVILSCWSKYPGQRQSATHKKFFLETLAEKLLKKLKTAF